MINNEIEHKYGNNYHILNDLCLSTQLAELSQESCKQPQINYLVADIYRHLFRTVINNEFPRTDTLIHTRMAASEGKKGDWQGTIIDPETRVVTVNIARAGALPSYICYETLNHLINPEQVRQDHIVMARTTDAEGRVTGAHLGDSKIGGDIDKVIMLFPDPMAATGSSLSTAIHHYKKTVSGKALKYISMHLIVTPDFLKRLRNEHPELIVYAVRLDRASSSEQALKSTPGTYWDQESGLNSIQYIVPGAGGLGELLNNAYC